MIDSPDSEVAIAAAAAGAEVARELFGQRLVRFDKDGEDFATSADIEAEKKILTVIRAARPDDAVLGEEGGHQGAVGATRQWLVDPLCGTLNYAADTMLVAVNVALRDGAAAVADPFTGEIFGTDGQTAWVRQHGIDTPLTPTSASRLVDVNLDPLTPSAPGLTLLTHPDFGRHFRPRVLSTTLALAWIAAGKHAAYVSAGRGLSTSVHFAAGIALCQAAGCVVTGLDGGPVNPASPGLVAAADTDTHELLMSMISRVHD